ncbi:MAG: hypothetical protein AAF585_03965 [Verrucomicrobiota bacterium]
MDPLTTHPILFTIGSIFMFCCAIAGWVVLFQLFRLWMTVAFAWMAGCEILFGWQPHIGYRKFRNIRHKDNVTTVGELIAIWTFFPIMWFALFRPLGEIGYLWAFFAAIHCGIQALHSLIAVPLPALGIAKTGISSRFIQFREFNEEDFREQTKTRLRNMWARQLPELNTANCKILVDDEIFERWLGANYNFLVEFRGNSNLRPAFLLMARGYEELTARHDLDSLSRALLLIGLLIHSRFHAPDMLERRGGIWREQLEEIGEPADFLELADAILNPDSTAQLSENASRFVRGQMLLMASDRAEDPIQKVSLLKDHLEIADPSAMSLGIWNRLTLIVPSTQLLKSFQAHHSMLLPCELQTRSYKRENIRVTLDPQNFLVVRRTTLPAKTVKYDLLDLEPKVVRRQQRNRGIRKVFGWLGIGIGALSAAAVLTLALLQLPVGFWPYLLIGALILGGLSFASLSPPTYAIRFREQRREAALSVNPPYRGRHLDDIIRVFRTIECALKLENRDAGLLNDEDNGESTPDDSGSAAALG